MSDYNYVALDEEEAETEVPQHPVICDYLRCSIG